MYGDRRALVTGGLGFIGSNLVIRLLELGARVTVVDPSVPGCGANPFNIEHVRDRLALIPLDIADADQFARQIGQSDVIFNLAGEISHIESMRCPERDLHINTLAQLRFLLVCRSARPGARVVFASTRQVYGAPEYLPVDEAHPIRPVDFNGIHKFAATQYHLSSSHRGELDAVVLRLTNVYGPRMALSLPHQGFLGRFLQSALTRKPLVVFGDGQQVRDPVYVDDVVKAFLLAGVADRPPSRVYNIGGPETLTVAAMAETIARAAGGVPVVQRPFPEACKSIDIGSYFADATRISRELGWSAQTRFEDGVRHALCYYRDNLEKYLSREEAQ